MLRAIRGIILLFANITVSEVAGTNTRARRPVHPLASGACEALLLVIGVDGDSVWWIASTDTFMALGGFLIKQLRARRTACDSIGIRVTALVRWARSNAKFVGRKRA